MSVGASTALRKYINCSLCTASLLPRLDARQHDRTDLFDVNGVADKGQRCGLKQRLLGKLLDIVCGRVSVQYDSATLPLETQFTNATSKSPLQIKLQLIEFVVGRTLFRLENTRKHG